MKKRALLIGINNYLNYEKKSLDGCINDTKIVASVLKKRFGFGEDDITFLRDKRATRKAIVKELKDILETCQSNDTIVFYFSGHGTRRRCSDPNKIDGLEETIMTYDTGSEPDSDRDIRDSDLRDWIVLLAKKTSNIHLFFDSCHSGSMVRDGIEIEGGRKIKGIDIDKDREVLLTDTEISAQSPNYRKIFPSSSTDSLSINWLSLADSYSLLTACRKDELAREYPITKNGKTIYHGAFTYFLVQVLNNLANVTYQDVFEELRAKIHTQYLSQNLQIEGNRERQLFSDVEINTMKYVSVEERSENKIILSAGAVHGLTANSEWSIYLPRTKHPLPENKLGKIKIVDVDVITSTAEIIEENESRKISAGCRAVEEIHYYEDQKKTVYIHSPLIELKGIEKIIAEDIKESSWIKAVDTKIQADFIVSLSTTGLAREIDSKIQIEIQQAADEAVLLKITDSGDDNLVKVRRNLEVLSRYSIISEMENPSSALNGLVEFTLFQKVNEEWQEAEPFDENFPKYVEGEQIAFQVVNKSSIPVYVSVLDLGLTKKIKLLYPSRADSERLGSNQAAMKLNPNMGKLKVGVEFNEKIRLFIPETAFLTKFPGINRMGGKETFKLIVTTAPTNLSLVEQGGVKTRTRADSPLEELLYKYSSESRTRDAEREISEQTDWLAVNRIFYLCKR